MEDFFSNFVAFSENPNFTLRNLTNHINILSTFMNSFPDSVRANTTLAYFKGFRLSKADVFSWNPFKKTSVYLVETSAEPGKDINDFWRGKFPINKHCLFVCLFACLISNLEHFKCLCIYGCIFKQTYSVESP